MSNSKKIEGRKVNRRDFLKGMGGGAIGAAVIPSVLGASQENASEEVPVISEKSIAFTVNGKSVSVTVKVHHDLLHILRDRLNLTGAKRVCGRGECGGCTVLVDGNPVYACMFPAFRADGKVITTIEGLQEGESLHPVQQAFIDKDGYQCGFCTPGFIMTSVALLNKKPDPTLDEIRQGLSGNLCRCGNYARMADAIRSASRSTRRS